MPPEDGKRSREAVLYGVNHRRMHHGGGDPRRGDPLQLEEQGHYGGQSRRPHGEGREAQPGYPSFDDFLFQDLEDAIENL